MKLPPCYDFIAFDINQSKFIKLYREICGLQDNGVNAYISLCRTLLLKGLTLGEYLHDTLISSEQPLVQKYIKSEDPNILAAIRWDISRIKQICSIPASEIKKALSESDNADLSDLAEYELGEFPYTAEYFIEHCRENGCDIFAKSKAFRLSGNSIVPIDNPDPVRLTDLKRYEAQRGQIIDNTLCLIHNKPANNVLLYGDRGTGKSATVKALLNEYKSLRMIQLDKNQIGSIFDIYGRVSEIPLHFIIFIDDLCFSEDDDGFFLLKQALDGSLAAKPNNVVIYATTNRRHLLKETAANRAENYVHKSDAVDDNMSLAERFGLFVTFMVPNKDQFIDIAQKIAADKGLNVDPEVFAAGLERFSIKRGGRSPRIARQYVDMLEAKLSLGLSMD